jgi:hypothetical protein
MAIDKVTTAAITDSAVTDAKLSFNSNQFRNIIINGDMSIAQRATSVSSITSAGYYTVDRWQIYLLNLGTWTQSQSTDVPSGQGFATSLKFDCTTADASPAASDEFYVRTKFEGQNLQYLKYGTSSAQKLTLSFWVKCNKATTASLMLFDHDNSKMVSKSYTINSANTWEKKTITFNGNTSNSFTNDANLSLDVRWFLDSGSNFTSGTPSGDWEANDNTKKNSNNLGLGSSTDNEWYITGVQLEVGSASDFEFLPFDVNLQRCQRYFQFRGGAGNVAIASGMSTQTNVGCFAIPYFSTMRSAPSLSFSSVMATDNVNYDSNVNSTAAIQSSNTSTRVYFNTASTNMTQYRPAFLTVNGSATSSGITLSAEL